MKSDWTRADALRIRNIRDKMGLCSCGSDSHWEVILELLTEAEDHSTRGFTPGAKGFYRDKWFEFGAKVLDSWDLLSHGTAIGFAWLEDDGKLLLRFLRDFGTESHSMEDNSGHPFWTIALDWGEKEDPNDSFGQWLSSTAAEATSTK